jgi:hypothetical protein
MQGRWLLSNDDVKAGCRTALQDSCKTLFVLLLVPGCEYPVLPEMLFDWCCAVGVR